MRRLNECARRSLGSNGFMAELEEPRNGLVLAVTAKVPVTMYRLDDEAVWGAGMRPDGVLVADIDPDGLVCFVELKGALDAERPDRPFQQIEAGMRHFAPVAGTHGAQHHARFRAGEDLPVASRGRHDVTIAPSPRHPVRGAIVVQRGGTRCPPRWLEAAGKRVLVSVVQRHGRYGRIDLTLDQLAEALGLAEAPS